MKNKIPSILKTLFALIILALLMLLFSACSKETYCHTYSGAVYNAAWKASDKCYTNGVNPVFPRKRTNQ